MYVNTYKALPKQQQTPCLNLVYFIGNEKRAPYYLQQYIIMVRTDKNP